MAQVWTDAEKKVLQEDPLHEVKEEFQHHSPHLRHVDLPEENDTQMGDIVKSHVPEAFADELKKDHVITEPATDFEETEAEFMEDDPLHNVKQELEHHSPHLRHVESPYSPGHTPASPGGGDVVKSEVPTVFKEELQNDHDIVKGHEGASNITATAEGVDVQSGENQRFQVLRDLTFVGLRRGGKPRFRISANVAGHHHHHLHSNPETSNMCIKDEADDEEREPNDAKPAEESISPEEPIATKPRGVPARGTSHFRISAHQGMRPGGPLSRDLKSETTSESAAVGADEAGADLPQEIKPKGPGLPNIPGGLSSSGPRRGGLARTGSGVPGGEHKGGGGGSLARTGSGVPGEQRLGGGLARTGSGVPGNSLARQGSGAFGGLARTGSGIPSSKGGNSDLKDFSSFLDSADFK